MKTGRITEARLVVGGGIAPGSHHPASCGNVPQTISLDPADRCLIAADRSSGHASVCTLNAETGLLAYGGTIDAPNVTGVVFQPLD